jgi:hypothetical protein
VLYENFWLMSQGAAVLDYDGDLFAPTSSPSPKRSASKPGGFHCNAKVSFSLSLSLSLSLCVRVSFSLSLSAANVKASVDERLGVGKFRLCHTLLYTCPVFLRTAASSAYTAHGQRVRAPPRLSHSLSRTMSPTVSPTVSLTVSPEP